MKFAREGGRGLPPGEIDLVAYVSWLQYERSVLAKSFRNYVSTIRRYCEGEALAIAYYPIRVKVADRHPPGRDEVGGEAPRERLEEENWSVSNEGCASVCMGQASYGLAVTTTRRWVAGWHLFFNPRWDTWGTMANGFHISLGFLYFCRMQVLMRTADEFTHDPEAPGSWIAEKSPSKFKSIIFMREVVLESKDKYGNE